MSDADYQRTYAQTSRARQREYDDERDAEIAAHDARLFAVDEGDISRRYSLAEMLAANEDHPDLRDWMLRCSVGDSFYGFVTVERVA